jgi:hypothetical protein
MKKLATLLAASLLLGSAFASTSPTPKKPAVQNGDRYWVINVGLTIPSGDHEDLGVSTGFTVGADYMMGNTGEGTSNTSWFAGIAAFFGQGDGGFDSTAWGIHLGVNFGLGQPGDDNPWSIELKGGFYQTQLSNGSDEDETGFGGSLGVVYTSRTGTGRGVRFSAGWYTLPEVVGVDHNGFFFNVGFPVG